MVRRTPRVWPTQDSLQPMEAVRRHGGLCPDDGGAGLQRRPAEGRIDRRNIPEGATHGFKPVSKKEGLEDKRGRLIGRTEGGLNTKLHAVRMPMGVPAVPHDGESSQRLHRRCGLADRLPAVEWLMPTGL